MSLPRFDYVMANSVREACQALKDSGPEAKAMGGGTDLLVHMQQRTHTPQVVVGLKKIAELKGISYDDSNGLQIGAGVTLHQVAEHPVVKEKYPGVAQAATTVGAVQHQFMGTIGGNLCLDTRCWYYNQSASWRRSLAPCHKLGGSTCHTVKGAKKCYAVYSGDMAPLLLALNSQVALADSSGQERVVPLENIFTGDSARPFTLTYDTIVTKIIIPPGEPHTGKYYKLRPRGSIDFAQVGVALAYYKDSKAFRVVVNAVDGRPLRLENVEAFLAQEKVSENIMPEVMRLVQAKVKPVANVFGSPGYRRYMAGVLVKQGLLEVAAS